MTPSQRAILLVLESALRGDDASAEWDAAMDLDLTILGHTTYQIDGTAFYHGTAFGMPWTVQLTDVPMKGRM